MKKSVDQIGLDYPEDKNCLKKSIKSVFKFHETGVKSVQCTVHHFHEHLEIEKQDILQLIEVPPGSFIECLMQSVPLV